MSNTIWCCLGCQSGNRKKLKNWCPSDFVLVEAVCSLIVKGCNLSFQRICHLPEDHQRSIMVSGKVSKQWSKSYMYTYCTAYSITYRWVTIGKIIGIIITHSCIFCFIYLFHLSNTKCVENPCVHHPWLILSALSKAMFIHCKLPQAEE